VERAKHDLSSDGMSGAVIGKNDQFYPTKDGKPRKINQKGNDGAIGLGRLVLMWPTPTAHMAKETNAPSEHKRNTPTLTAQVNWPTPRASDFKGATSAEAMSKAAARGFSPNLPEATAASVGGGKLNPTWVEWLMGWPLGWTDLKPLEMDKSHCVQQPLGES